MQKAKSKTQKKKKKRSYLDPNKLVASMVTSTCLREFGLIVNEPQTDWPL